LRPLKISRSRLVACAKFAAAALLTYAAAFSIRNSRISAQDFPAIIGRIEGDDVEVVTKTPTGSETDAGATVVASGSDVTLHSGHALLLLNAGGQISICGPAHFKMVKSSGALTLALDYGRVHPSLESSDGFTIYMPTMVATPIAIGGGSRDMTVGLEQGGEMCIVTARGAMRVEPQFSDQSMIIPQGGTASLAEGQIVSLHADASACSCDFSRARLQAPKSSQPQSSAPKTDREIATLAQPSMPERKKPEPKPPVSTSANEPIYTVLMPPLSFDAKSPEPPPDPSPETILLVREVRVRPSVEFQGHVNPAPALPPTPTAPATPAVSLPPPAPPPAKTATGLFDRVRAFFHRLISSN
jgi:hypothetical protein